MKILKKLVAGGCALAMCLCLSSCGQSNQALKELKAAQATLQNMQSGHLIVTSSIKSDQRESLNTTDFTYKQNDGGVFSYCQAQQDSNNKLIFCEQGDGVKSEQWLIGKGWTSVDPAAYTPKNNHQYIKLITNELDSKDIQEVISVPELENTRYTVEFDAQKLNNSIYKDTDIEVVSQTVSFLVGKDSMLLEYTDESVVLDKTSGKNSEYSFVANITEHNTLVELTKPEIRVNAAMESQAAEAPTDEVTAAAEQK